MEITLLIPSGDRRNLFSMDFFSYYIIGLSEAIKPKELALAFRRCGLKFSRIASFCAPPFSSLAPTSNTVDISFYIK